MLPAWERWEKEKKMNCPSCGNQNVPRAKFCTNCGTRLAGGNGKRLRKTVIFLLACLAGYAYFSKDTKPPRHTPTPPTEISETVVVKPSDAKRKVVKTDGRFTAYDDGTVYDKTTNLLWAAKDNGSDITWPDAKKICEDYTAGGFTDWRLPTLDELATLYDENLEGYKMECCPTCLNVKITDFIKLTCCCPWASETKDNGSLAGVFVFGNGLGYWTHPRYDYVKRVLPVRVGN